jgi:hypothetical protein
MTKFVKLLVLVVVTAIAFNAAAGWEGAVPAIKNNTYKNDLTYGKGLFNVGKAKEIWNGNAKVTAAMLAAAKGVKITTIKQKHIVEAKAKLKQDFQAAENHWKKWKGVP